MTEALIRPVVRADREKWQVLWDGYTVAEKSGFVVYRRRFIP